MTEPHLQGICKDCDTYRERTITTITRRCTWTCTEVDPKQKCPCRPSHFVPARDATVRVIDSSAKSSEKVLDELYLRCFNKLIFLRLFPSVATSGELTAYKQVVLWIEELRQEKKRGTNEGKSTPSKK